MEHMEMIDHNPEEKGDVTILDVLGVDLCRDAILDHAHIRDIVRSERVCRRWQRAVLDYLPRCRNLTLSIYQRSRVYKHSLRTVMIRDDGTFPVRHVLEKLGPLIVSLHTNRSDPEFYEDISCYCPRLRLIELKRLSTRGPKNISEQKLGRAFQNIELEKVKLVKCYTLDGKFLHLMNLSCLKTLSLINSELAYDHMKSKASRLYNVTSLEISTPLFDKFLLLVDNMPKLENIFLKGKIDQIEFVEHCSRFENLKRIDMRDLDVSNEYLECLARYCKNLEYLNIASSINSPCGRGLATLVLRPSPGTLICFTRKRKESLEALLEFLEPFNDALQARERKKITIEMFCEATKSTEQCDSLELRLAYPILRKAKSHPELKIILNVSLVRNVEIAADEEWEDFPEERFADNNLDGVDVPNNVNALNNMEDWQQLQEEGIAHNDDPNYIDAPDNIDDPDNVAVLNDVDAPDNVHALDNVDASDNVNPPNNIED